MSRESIDEGVEQSFVWLNIALRAYLGEYPSGTLDDPQEGEEPMSDLDMLVGGLLYAKSISDQIFQDYMERVPPEVRPVVMLELSKDADQSNSFI